MKICFYTENYYKGGLDTFLINLFNHWPDDKDDLTLVCNDAHPGLETLRNQVRRPLHIKTYKRFYTSAFANGMGSNPIAKWKISRAFFVLSYLILQFPLLRWFYTWSLTRFFKNSNFDRLMVVNGGYPASLLGICAVIAWEKSGKGTKAVFNFHNSTTLPGALAQIPEYALDRALIQSAGHIVSVSKNCLHSLFLRESFKDASALSYIHNGIEPIEAVPAPPDGRYCLMLSTYEPRKGHLFLLQAFQKVVRHIPDVKLKIYGYVAKEHEINRISQEVTRLGLEGKVELNRFTSEKAGLLSNAAILVVPSQENESFGLTIIEAMSLGIPVVATDTGGIPEVLEGTGAGMICPKGNPELFADYMIEILNNNNLAAEMSANGKKAFQQQYTADRMAQQYYQLLHA